MPRGKKKPAVGDQIQCRVATDAYQPFRDVKFLPGMIGTVAAITPKVHLPRTDAPDDWLYNLGLDRGAYFLVVDFEVDGKKYRTGVNFCNATKVTNVRSGSRGTGGD